MNAIDRERLLKWLKSLDSTYVRNEIIMKIESGAFDIKPPEVPDLKPGDQVRHKKEKAFIRGHVLEISKSGKTARVEWVEYDRNVFRYGAPWPAYYHIDKLEKVETHD